jgi:hypothetical protein
LQDADHCLAHRFFVVDYGNHGSSFAQRHPVAGSFEPL